MQHSREWRIRREALDHRTPRVPVRGFHLPGAVPLLRSRHHDGTPLVPESSGERRRRVQILVPRRRHQPRPRFREDLRRRPSHDQSGGSREFPCSRFAAAEDPNLLVLRVPERPAPDRRRRQRVIAPIGVVESPPVRQQAEGQVQPTERRHRLQRHQQARGREEAPAMAKRLTEVPRRMQRVHRQHHIMAVEVEPLRARVPLDVQRPDLHPGRRARQTPLRLREQRCRAVREDVVRQLAGERRQQPFRRARRSRAQLQNPEPASLGQG